MVSMILLVAAFVFFLLASIGVSSPRINLLGAGLACWVLSLLLTKVH